MQATIYQLKHDAPAVLRRNCIFGDAPEFQATAIKDGFMRPVGVLRDVTMGTLFERCQNDFTLNGWVIDQADECLVESGVAQSLSVGDVVEIREQDQRRRFLMVASLGFDDITDTILSATL